MEDKIRDGLLNESEKNSDKNSEIKPEDKKDYEFVTETIKRKPINKRKIAQKISYSVGFGLLAGLIACLVFAYLAPKLYEKVNPQPVVDDTVPITIPRDENKTEEQNIENSEINPAENAAANSSADTSVATVTNDNTDITDDTDNKENTDDIGNTPDSGEDDNNDVPDESGDNDITEAAEINDNAESGNESEDGTSSSESEKSTERKGFDIEDYKNLYIKFREINNEVGKSLATVSIVSDETDWFMNSYETGKKYTGIILADNGRELLIIANIDRPDRSDSKNIEVTFCDGECYKGSIKKFDPNTGLTVVAVNLNRISDNTKNDIKMAELGNSTLSTLVGMPVMAVGSPLGIEGSMQLGLITSSTHILEYPDSSLRYLTTDIYGAYDGSGVIIDLDGNVVGIIFHGGTASDSRNLIHAYGISDVKAKIEKISNGQDLAYLGIVGTDVTEEAIEELGVPKGTYVKQVAVDSPAMRGGIRNGDVIVKFGTTDISSFSDFTEAMLKSQPGDHTMITVKRPAKDDYVEFSYEISLEALK